MMENDDVAYTGYPSKAELEKSPGFPSEERMSRGPTAVIECVQHIPCNPCEAACPSGAISVGDPITNLPVLDEEKCVGCGNCVAACPGLAIFTVDTNYGETEAAVEIPYEYIPVPEKGAVVSAVNRAGEVICRASVLQVRSPLSFAGTVIVKLAVPKEYAGEARGIKRLPRAGEE